MAMKFATHTIPLLLAAAALAACGKSETPATAEAPSVSTAGDTQPVPISGNQPLTYRILEFSGTRSTQRGTPGEEIGANLSYPQTGEAVLDNLIETWIAARCPVSPDSVRAATPEGCMNQVLDECVANANAATGDAPVRCTFGARIEPVLNDKGLFSLKYTGNHYSGGAHGMPDAGYFNYDVEGERVLALDDVVVVTPALNDLLNLRMRRERGVSADQTLKSVGFFEDRLPLTQNVLIESEGLRFTWQSYEVAPYALGQPSLLLSYAELGDLISATSPLRRLLAGR